MTGQQCVDGIPVLHAETSGPTRAGLVFRVGQADETLPRRGITHLVEHLALHSTGVADYHYNGMTGLTHTSFVSAGTPEQVVTYLADVCAALRELPVDRIVVEKDILRTEQIWHGNPDGMLIWRHGARDYGLPEYPEHTTALTEADLREWVARYFTRANAVLWVAGESVPDGLRLDLPDGERRPAPAPSSTLPSTPAWFAGSQPDVLWTGLVTAGPAGRVLADLLGRRLAQDLVVAGGLASATHASYDVLYGTVAQLTARAALMPDKRRVLLGAFVDLLASVAGCRITDEEVGTLVEAAMEQTRHAERTGRGLPRQAERLLAGVPLISYEQQVAALHEVTATDVAAAAREAYDSGLLRTPALDASWTGFAEAPWRSAKAVTGRAFRSKNGHSRLIVGPDGVTSEHGENVGTVRYDDCAVVLCRADGGRVLIGHDAITVAAEPAWYGDEAVREIDARVSPALRSDQPARTAEQIGTLGEPPRVRAPLWAVLRRDAPIYGFVARQLVGAAVLAFLGAILVMVGVTMATGNHAYGLGAIFVAPGAYLLQRQLRRMWQTVDPLIAR